MSAAPCRIPGKGEGITIPPGLTTFRNIPQPQVNVRYVAETLPSQAHPHARPARAGRALLLRAASLQTVMPYIDNNSNICYALREGVCHGGLATSQERRYRPMNITLDELCSLVLVGIGIMGLILQGIDHKK